MNPWEALSTPMEDRPGDTYRKSVKRRIREERRGVTQRKPTPGEPFYAAALVATNEVARLVPITVVDFYPARKS